MKTNPVCSDIQDDLLALYHNELPLIRRAIVRRHVAQCAHCHKEMETMDQISTTLKQNENNTATPLNNDLRNRILANVPDVPAAQAPPNKTLQLSPRPLWQVWGAVGAMACVAAMVAVPMLIAPKISNTFNAAGNQMTDDDDSMEYFASAGNSPTSEPEPAQKQTDTPSYSFSDGHLKLKKSTIESAANRLSGDGAAKDLLTPYRRVHKQGSLAVDVDAIEEGSNAVEDAVKKAGGFVANNDLSTASDGVKSAALEIRVPVKEFDNIMKQIAALGEVKAKRVVGEDITAKVSDANEENNVVASDLRIKLEQYRLAKERAAKKEKVVPNDWQHRAEIRQMRVQLAQVRARLDLLKKMSDFAELSVQLRQTPEGINAGGFVGEITNTGRNALDSFLVAVRLPINILIYILAYSPFWLPILIAWRYFNRTNARHTAGP